MLTLAVIFHLLNVSHIFRNTARFTVNTGHESHTCLNGEYLPVYTVKLIKYTFSMFSHKRDTHRCGLCGKSFAKKSHLKDHVLIHTGDKPNECETCGKSYTEKGSLTKHKFIHTGEKPHRCDACGKAFIHKHHLITHMLIHTGDKPHDCETCGKSFTVKDSLTKHMLIHTGEKPQ